MVVHTFLSNYYTEQLLLPDLLILFWGVSMNITSVLTLVEGSNDKRYTFSITRVKRIFSILFYFFCFCFANSLKYSTWPDVRKRTSGVFTTSTMGRRLQKSNNHMWRLKLWSLEVDRLDLPTFFFNLKCKDLNCPPMWANVSLRTATQLGLVIMGKRRSDQLGKKSPKYGGKGKAQDHVSHQ